MLTERGIPSIMYIHDILSRSYSCQLDANLYLPVWLKEWSVERYKSRKDSAWNTFDMLIAINQDEQDYARQRVRSEINLSMCLWALIFPSGPIVGSHPHPGGLPIMAVWAAHIINRMLCCVTARSYLSFGRNPPMLNCGL